MNIFLNSLAILAYFAIYAAHRKTAYKPYATLGMIIAFLGIGVFYATNRAFPMLQLSQQYAATTDDLQRTVLESAGQSMLSVGQSHTPGTFLAFFLLEVAGIIMSLVMLRAKVFSKATAYMGILGFSFLLIFEFTSSFLVGLNNAAMILAMLGGLLSMAWYILTAWRLIRLGRSAL